MAVAFSYQICLNSWPLLSRFWRSLFVAVAVRGREAMAFLQHISPRMLSLIRDGAQFALEPGYDHPDNSDRFLDFLEVYSGEGNLNSCVGKVACHCWIIFFIDIGNV